MMNERSITPTNALFKESKSGFLTLTYAGVDYKRVTLRRAFPVTEKNKCILVYEVGKNGKKEIGIIYTLDEFRENDQKIIEAELNRIYFIPEILKVISITNEYGYDSWCVETSAGKKMFTVAKDNISILVAVNRIMITDIHHNRYSIEDYRHLDKSSMRLLEMII
ncbi:MAG: DUF1854 domain-containing protein [Carnobacterium sp.]